MSTTTAAAAATATTSSGTERKKTDFAADWTEDRVEVPLIGEVRLPFHRTQAFLYVFSSITREHSIFLF
jgi:hypothetical protein